MTIMKKTLLLAALAAFSVCAAAQPANHPLPVRPDTLRILAIANSFGDDGTQWLPGLLEGAGIHNVIVARLYIGGCSLERHCKEYRDNLQNYRYDKSKANRWERIADKTGLLTGLEDEPWDVVTIQERSGYSGDWSHFEPWIGELIGIIRRHCTNPDAAIVWHGTWAYARSSHHKDFPWYGNNQMIMYKGILDCQEKLQAKYNIPIVIPSGTAVQNARWTPGLENGKDLTRDGYHLDKGYTRYLAACTWFETLVRPTCGKSVKGNPFRMQGTEFEIPAPRARKLQRIAARTVRQQQ